MTVIRWLLTAVIVRIAATVLTVRTAPIGRVRRITLIIRHLRRRAVRRYRQVRRPIIHWGRVLFILIAREPMSRRFTPCWWDTRRFSDLP